DHDRRRHLARDDVSDHRDARAATEHSMIARGIAAIAILAGMLGAQQPAPIVVRVRVVDTSGTPIPDANVTIVQGLQELLASGASDNGGNRQLSIPRRVGDYQLVVRRIGFQRADRFFAAPRGDSVAFQIELRRAVQTIAPVAVTAREDVKRKSYHIEADEIMASKRPIFDGFDVLTKLKPDMLEGRSGQCPLQNVWVNGRRVFDYSPNAMVIARQPQPTPAARVPKGGRQPVQPKIPNLSGRSILSSIKPEHIAEINYADCFDKTVDKMGAQAAAFVVLKTGVDFEVGIGSFVVQQTADSLATALPPVHVANADSALAYRNRLLGVYDEATGDPVQGVEVIDLATGTKAVTTRTGTVALGYLAEGANKVRLHKLGYTDVDLDVVIAPGTTVPITTVLAPRP
ncbi:MAG: carboxypeptidase regulatory-like domain-containing protein, partial [bacterium]